MTSVVPTNEGTVTIPTAEDASGLGGPKRGAYAYFNSAILAIGHDWVKELDASS